MNDYTTKPAPPNWPPTCIAKYAGWCSNGNLNPTACLTFKVDDAAQSVADANGICVDKSICEAAAAGFPGGAFCTP